VEVSRLDLAGYQGDGEWISNLASGRDELAPNDQEISLGYLCDHRRLYACGSQVATPPSSNQ
jgi:hypothetical protein